MIVEIDTHIKLIELNQRKKKSRNGALIINSIQK
jgi:hypothetical protein